MVDPVQMVLLVVILVLTGLLVVLGVQVFYILKELRNTLSKTNKVLDRADSISENIDVPLSAISSLVVGAKASSLLSVVKFVGTLLGRNKEDEKSRRD